MQRQTLSPDIQTELEAAVLALANRTLATGALLVLAAIAVTVAGALALSLIPGETLWRQAAPPLIFAIVVLTPSAIALYLSARAQALTSTRMQLFLIWFATAPGLYLALLLVEPHQVAASYVGAIGMYMMIMIALTALVLNPRLSLGVAVWCAVQHAALYALARPSLAEVSGPDVIIGVLTSWGELLRQVVFLILFGAIVALFGMMVRQVLARLLAEQRRRDEVEKDNIRREAREAVLQANSAAKSAFVATMSHELRTPMNAILGHAQHLQAAPELSTASREGVRTILSSSRHLLELIAETLDTAAIESGKMTLSMGPVHPASVVHGVRTLLGPQASAKGLALTTVVDSGVPTEILSDEKRLRQVLVNLIGNAIKFTEHGSVEVSVDAPVHEELRIRIEDSGAGIPEDRLQTIFERYERVESSAQEGSGLGLAITKQIVEALGGAIALTSVVGRGTQVEVRLPTGVSAPAEEPSLTVYPGAQDAAWLRESAAIGDLSEVARRARELASRDAALAPFSARVCALADDFEDARILELLDEVTHVQ